MRNVQLASDALDSASVLEALRALRKGDFSVRLPAGHISAGIVVLLLAGSVLYHTRFAA